MSALWRKKREETLMKQKFYLTTAIAYASRKPHIGNTYDIVLADTIARYKKLRGYDVFLLTGSDEHGMKIGELAKAAGIEPQKYVDRATDSIKAVWDSVGADYNRFIRTTDADHVAVVQKIFKKLYDQGDIYKGTYEGKYCTPCESFFTASQIVDGKCPDCGRPVQDAKEEAYFLKLSKYQDRLVEYYESQPDFFAPASRKAEMINNFIKPGLSDLCVSRSTFTWGIPVPFDDKHVTYVWLDALSNYITAIGYDPDGSSEQYQKLWPADLHVIGKDIVRFHTIYWPIILMALGEPLPKQVLGHPWVLFGEDKMSKSKGNVVYADEVSAKFGKDAVRYYLLSEIPFAQDGNFTYESFFARFNTDLANTFGNLVNRTVAMTNKYFGGSVQKPAVRTELDEDLAQTAQKCAAAFVTAMERYHTADATEAAMDLARRCNKYIDETMPWALAKDEAQKERLEAVLWNLLEGVRILTVLLAAAMPDTCAAARAQIGLNDTAADFDGETVFGIGTDYTVGEAKPLFARIDTEAAMKDILAEQAQKAAAAAAEQEKAEEKAALISIDDFAKVELKAGKILTCEPVKKSKKLLQLSVDLGEGSPRTIASGIAPWYQPEELIGKTVAVVSNLTPAKLCGVESNGMILAADCGEDVKVLFLDGIAPGSKIR